MKARVKAGRQPAEVTARRNAKASPAAMPDQRDRQGLRQRRQQLRAHQADAVAGAKHDSRRRPSGVLPSIAGTESSRRNAHQMRNGSRTLPTATARRTGGAIDHRSAGGARRRPAVTARVGAERPRRDQPRRARRLAPAISVATSPMPQSRAGSARPSEPSR